MSAVIETPRLRLRKARPEDLGDLFAVFSDLRAMRYWDSLPHDDIVRTARFLPRLIASAPPESDDFVVERAGRVIGKAGCWRRGEIGFILHPDHWGQGIGREALAAVIPHVFASLELDRLEADVDPRNAASIALLTGLGFRETGRAARTFCVGGEWSDSVYFALERPAGVRTRAQPG
jgi:ribosomal-protein-alanine N-acetyltransferase